ncbi:MAG TPA: hypothetical protein VHM91_08810 [Verrucomicrobiales bacterium]|jgi:hypothetical protein|nr:hypothetical protein [Verrucomicrobiales bacterium]
MIFVLLLFVLMATGFVVQDFIPDIDWAWHARIFAVPVIFFACAISLPFSVMLFFAFATGFVWDALNHISVNFPDVTRAMVEVGAAPQGPGGAFGFSIFLYALLGSLMHGIRPLFRRGRWELPVLMTGAGTFLLLSMEYLFINFRRAGFSMPVEVWYHIGATAVLSMIIAPFVFFVIDRLAKLSGYSIRYEGLNYRRWTVP